ncbi:MAG: dimethyl sulfoxide reductase anchor subunit [Candidatus Omnitrophica bacterium]|nr:dimethyl sulfoxide reductase anchor subunit [Candidatus Omnitrophota bacterium]
MSETFSLVDMLDTNNLPLKNRVNKEGIYAPAVLIPSEPLKEGQQYRFHFDMSRCVGCQCCVVACNEQNNNPSVVNWRRVGEIEGGVYPHAKRHHFSMACNHCLDPSCLTGCPTDAYEKDKVTGIVKHKADECIGCQYCTWNCPYGVPQFNPERNIVTKCDMCHSRLADGMAPACVAACPESAIRIETVSTADWRENHASADAPYLPDSGITLSTTRITLPDDMPGKTLKLNRHRVQPEHPHTSLIFMTVLTQLAAGGFLTLWLGDLLSGVFRFLQPLREFLVYGACGILIVTGGALSASVFHLGRPLFAYKALRMWKRSWLSREVLFFTIFSFLGGGYATLLLAANFFQFPVPAAARLVLGGIVAASGMAGIYASAKIYLVPARPSWNTIRTPLRFFLTGFILGPLFSFVVYSIYVLMSGHEKISASTLGPIFGWLGVSGLAALAQLLVLFARLFHLSGEKTPELYDSAVLLVRRFNRHFLTRIGLLVLGSFILPLVYLIYFLTHAAAGAAQLLVFAGVSFLIALTGEFLGRYLFFVTVVPKNMPGSFFTVSGSAR